MTPEEIDTAIRAAVQAWPVTGAPYRAIWNVACDACANACDDLPSSEPDEWGADAYEMQGIARAVQRCRELKVKP